MGEQMMILYEQGEQKLILADPEISLWMQEIKVVENDKTLWAEK